MTQPTQITSLETLITLRERAVDRLTAELAAKERERERYRANLLRMAGLCAGGSSQGLQAAALSLNSAAYKQSVLQMADTHRTDLTLHEADMAVTQRALCAAAARRAVLDQVLAQQQRRLLAERQRAERKRQDELASQLWCRKARP
jgi:flagellar export protein FliJ